MNPTNAQLRQFITTTFNDSELETFCFDYFPEVKYTRGMEFSYKVEQLISYCQRRSLETNLLTNLQQERPQPFAIHFSSTKTEIPPILEAKPRNSRQIFISYAHEDAELAGRLAGDLEIEGWPVWIALDSIRPGEKWASAISRGLDESGIFVLLLTPHAVKSRWVRHETDVAVEMEHEGEMRFIPLLVEACRVPALWRAYQRIPFRGGYGTGLSALLAALVDEQPPATAEGGTAERPTADWVFVEKKPRSLFGSGIRIPPRYLPTAQDKTGLNFIGIPAEEFLFGDDKTLVHLEGYWISKTPVTNEAYKRFIDANPQYVVPDHWDKDDRVFLIGNEKHPVVYVSFEDVKAYCHWAGNSVGLPTEQEWEKAARGIDGREYPWGNEQPTSELCNFGRNEGGTTLVGKYSPQGDSPYGCVDMSGNIWEWTSSLFEEGKDWRVLRGGSWFLNQDRARAASRRNAAPGARVNYLGFRVVVRRPPSHHEN